MVAAKNERARSAARMQVGQGHDEEAGEVGCREKLLT